MRYDFFLTNAFSSYTLHLHLVLTAKMMSFIQLSLAATVLQQMKRIDYLPPRNQCTRTEPWFLIVPVLLLCVLVFSGTRAQAQNPCAPCSLPCALSPTDTLMDAWLSNGRVLRNVRSAQREFVNVFGSNEQAIRLFIATGTGCRDTLLRVANILRFEYGGIGALGAPRSIPILPAREYFRTETNVVTPPLNFVEVTPILGYGGSDTSSRNVGFSSVYAGVEGLIAPFDSFFGEDLSLALGGGLMIEDGRTRFPVMAHLRWTFTGSPSVEEVFDYQPSPCQFGCGGSGTVATPPEEGFIERISVGEKDSSVIVLHDKQIKQSTFRPFLFVEGGTIFDGSFEGSGTENAINKDDHAPYFYGGGLGTPIGSFLTLSLAYRRMQLHLLTPCETCPDKNVLNTNRTHSILLKIGGRFTW